VVDARGGWGMMTTMTTADAQVLQFVEPLPGFDDEDSYTLSAIDDQGVLLAMRSVRDPGLRFVLTSPGLFFEDYEPVLGHVVNDALGAESDSDVRTLLVLTIGEGLSDATANMRAPIVVSVTTGRAMQVVLDDEALPMRRPLVDRH
jgi:flagellar assembly factor FliW